MNSFNTRVTRRCRVLAICRARLEERHVERNRDQTTEQDEARTGEASGRVEWVGDEVNVHIFNGASRYSYGK